MDFQQAQFGQPFMGNEFGSPPMGPMPMETSPLISPTPHFSQPSGFTMQQPQAQLFNNFQEPSYFPPTQTAQQPHGSLTSPNPFPNKKSPFGEHDLHNYLNNLRGTPIHVFMTFNGSSDWNDRSFNGILETVGTDFITISEPKHRRTLILPIRHLDWIEVDSSILR